MDDKTSDQFYTILWIAIALFLVDILSGLIPIFVRLNVHKTTQTLSWINCFSGGFLIGSIFLEMLPEAHSLLSTIHYDRTAFVMFIVGYLFVLFLEEWVHTIGVEYKTIMNSVEMSEISTSKRRYLTTSHSENEEHFSISREKRLLMDVSPIIHDEKEGRSGWLSRNDTERMKTNNVTAYILLLSCVLENLASTIAIGMQTDVSNLWAMTLVILLTEPVQVLIFVFQFRQCKIGMKSISSVVENVMLSNEDSLVLSDDDTSDEENLRSTRFKPQERYQSKLDSVKIELIFCIIFLALTNTAGLFIGNILSQLILQETKTIENLCAGVASAFVGGIFFYLATVQMINKEFKANTDTEAELQKKAGLILLGLILSSVVNIVTTIMGID